MRIICENREQVATAGFVGIKELHKPFQITVRNRVNKIINSSTPKSSFTNSHAKSPKRLRLRGGVCCLPSSKTQWCREIQNMRMTFNLSSKKGKGTNRLASRTAPQNASIFRPSSFHPLLPLGVFLFFPHTTTTAFGVGRSQPNGHDLTQYQTKGIKDDPIPEACTHRRTDLLSANPE